MRLSCYSWLLAALIAHGVIAQRANLGIWGLEACDNYHDATVHDTTGLTGGRNEVAYVQSLFDTSIDLANAAIQSLKFCLKKRPSKRRQPTAYRRWVRIADSMLVTLGFFPDPDRVERSSDRYWKDAFAIYYKIYNTLQARHNHPRRGYNTALSSLDDYEPIVMCGENFEWVDKEDDLPGTDMPVKSLPVVGDQIDAGLVAGGWWRDRRWVSAASDREKPVICSGGTLAVANGYYDMIMLCDRIFTTYTKSLWIPPANIQEGTDLQDVLNAPHMTVFHELTHWYSGLSSGRTWATTPDENFRITDQQAVNSDGYLIYKTSDGGDEYRSEPISQASLDHMGWKRVKTYSVGQIWKLSKKHSHRLRKHNTGPEKSLRNAESLTAFATMMYYDGWLWARRGYARDPVEAISVSSRSSPRS